MHIIYGDTLRDIEGQFGIRFTERELSAWHSLSHDELVTVVRAQLRLRLVGLERAAERLAAVIEHYNGDEELAIIPQVHLRDVERQVGHIRSLL